MSQISHEEARHYILAAADHLLGHREQLTLDEHLQTCESCRNEARAIGMLDERVQQLIHTRLHAMREPSANILANVQAKNRRNIFMTRTQTVFATAILALMLFAFFALIPSLQKKQPARQEPPSPVQTPVESAMPVDTPTDRWVAFASSTSGDPEIYIQSTNGNAPINISNHPGYDGNPVWSPDGRKIAFESERTGNYDVFIFDLETGTLSQLTVSPANDVVPTWSPDGMYLMVQNDTSGQWVSQLFRSDGSSSGFILYPEWKFKGWVDSYLYYTYQEQGEDRLALTQLDGTVVFSSAIPGGDAYNTSIAVVDDAVYFQGGDCFSNKFDYCKPNSRVYRAPLSGGAFKPIISAGTITGYQILPDGILYIDGPEKGFPVPTIPHDTWKWIRRDSQGGVTILNEWKDIQSICVKEDPNNVVFSPISMEENWLVFVRCAADQKSWLYLASQDGSEIRLLMDTPITAKDAYLDIDAKRSADGHWLVARDDTDNLSVVVEVGNGFARTITIQAAGARVQPQPYTPANQPQASAASPQPASTLAPIPATGTWLGYVSNDKIYLMHPDGSEKRQLPLPDSWIGEWAWSPDGSRLAVSGGAGLYVVDTDGSNLRKLSSDGWRPVWSPDGSQIAYSFVTESNITHLMVVNVENGQAMEVFRDDVGFEWGAPQLQWASNGKTLQFVIEKWSGGVPLTTEDSWTLMQVGTTNTPARKILAQANVPIVSWFGSDQNVIYLTRAGNEWRWMHNNQTLSTIQLNSGCTDYISQTIFSAWSPKKDKLLISLDCASGTKLYIANPKDFTLTQLFKTNQKFLDMRMTSFMFASWSPDSRLVLIGAGIKDAENDDIYQFDVQAALNDPNYQPVTLVGSGFNEYYPLWRPQP